MPITSPVERISGPSSGVGALEAVERQHGLLDRDVLAVAEPLTLARQVQLGDPLAEHDPAGELGQRHADRLGDERHRARGARVGLDHVQLAGVYGVLHVQQPDDADRERELARGRSGSARASPPRASAAAARRRCRPEWTPASSTCCMIPPIHTSAPSHRASTSTSIAFSRKRSRKISAVAVGPRRLAAADSRRGPRASRRSPSPVPRARRRGARAADSRRGSACASASCDRARGRIRRRLVAELGRAARRSAPRSSARSIASTLVPSSGTPAAASPAASFSGVCPPNCTITPSGRSTSITPSTSSASAARSRAGRRCRSRSRPSRGCS